jgi:hypothetical protein
MRQGHDCEAQKEQDSYIAACALVGHHVCFRLLAGDAKIHEMINMYRESAQLELQLFLLFYNGLQPKWQKADMYCTQHAHPTQRDQSCVTNTKPV